MAASPGGDRATEGREIRKYFFFHDPHEENCGSNDASSAHLCIFMRLLSPSPCWTPSGWTRGGFKPKMGEDCRTTRGCISLAAWHTKCWHPNSSWGNFIPRPLSRIDWTYGRTLRPALLFAANSSRKAWICAAHSSVSRWGCSDQHTHNGASPLAAKHNRVQKVGHGGSTNTPGTVEVALLGLSLRSVTHWWHKARAISISHLWSREESASTARPRKPTPSGEARSWYNGSGWHVPAPKVHKVSCQQNSQGLRMDKHRKEDDDAQPGAIGWPQRTLRRLFPPAECR